jgi:hypothetical protein
MERFPAQTPGAVSIVDGSCVKLPIMKPQSLHESIVRLWHALKRWQPTKKPEAPETIPQAS